MNSIRLLLVMSLLPAALAAQSTIARETELLTAPGGRTLAVLRSGAAVTTSRLTRGGATQVTIEGWVHRSTLGGRRDTFSLSVTARGGAMLRGAASENGRILGRLETGMGLSEVSRRGEWVRIRRTAWVPTRALSSGTARTAAAPAQRRAPPVRERRPAAAAPTAQAAAPDTGRAPATSERAVSEDLTSRRAIALHGAPGDRVLATVQPGARLEAMARDRGWVRVRVEGWVRDTGLVPADTAQLTAADIRSNPEAMRGRTVRWEVQKISFQVADALRKDLEQNEPYLLARGPGGENALLYLALPPSLVERARTLPSLRTVIITARVRTGRSEPAGIPVLDVISIGGS